MFSFSFFFTISFSPFFLSVTVVDVVDSISVFTGVVVEDEVVDAALAEGVGVEVDEVELEKIAKTLVRAEIDGTVGEFVTALYGKKSRECGQNMSHK